MKTDMSPYKSDWEEARQRMASWWEGKTTDRPVASVIAPAKNRDSSLYMNKVPEMYVDMDTVFNNLNHTLGNTFWGGEAFPWHYVYYGPMFRQVLFGCVPNFTETTTWYDPCHDSLDDLLSFEFDECNRWWILEKELIVRSAQKSNGRYLISLNGVGAIMDIISGLIGIEKLLISMIDEPEKLKAVRDKLAVFGDKTFNELYDITREYQNGTIDWMGIWSPGKMQSTQCDLSVMISPEAFDDFVREDIESTYRYVDHGVYHMDGEEQIRHLNTLLSIEKIKLIQWVPSSRYDQSEYTDPLNWIRLIRRIQDAGKSVMVDCPPARVTDLLKKVDRHKVYLRVNCADERSANQVLRELDRAGK